MKRRGFLGVLAGGAVAGPPAAKKAAARIGAGSGSSLIGGAIDAPSAGHVGLVAQEYAKDHRNYLLGRIAELKRKLAGELTDQEIEERRLHDQFRVDRFATETDVLRSLSETSKHRRVSEFSKVEASRRERFYVRRELSDYLKQLAGLDGTQ